MKSAQRFPPAADDSALPKSSSAPASRLSHRFLVQGALVVALACVSLAAMARHHGWLSMLGAGDGKSLSHSLLAATSAPEPESAPAGAFTVIDVTGAGTNPMEGTFAIAINAGGEVTGVYSNSLGVLHGFVRDRFGNITKFDAPGSGTNSIGGTIPLSINTAGEIAGTIIDSNHTSHGFVRSASGVITEFEAPGAGTAADRGTSAWRINDAGDVVGFFSTGSFSTPSTYHGFLRKATTDAITNIDAPDAGTGENPANGKKEGTQAYSINNAGQIVGSYVDSSNDRHGFIYTNGNFVEFDAPGAITGTTGHKQGMNGTTPTGIDAAGVVVGAFTDSKGRQGFVRNTDRSFEVFNGPSAGAGPALVPGTFPFSIDSSTGVAVGFDADASGLYHAFERSAAGAVIEIKPPGSIASTLTLLPGAGAGGVNESGDVAGGYSDGKGVYHGFVYTPAPPPQVATPTFSPNPAKGPYAGPLSVQIKDATASATIYYTLDETVPPTSKTSKKYSGAITIPKTTTIKAVAVLTGYVNSNVATGGFAILKPQTISWPKITGTHDAGSKLTLNASASSGLAVTYTSKTPKVCTVSKSTATLLIAGNCTIDASQAGNAVYAPANPVPQTFAVSASK